MLHVLRVLWKVIATTVICTAFMPILVAVTIFATLIFLPLPATLPDPRPVEGSRISHVYDANGEEIGIFREFEQNIPVQLADIPVHLKQAVISSEDRSFYSHGGVDIRGSLRALNADLRGKSIVQGGSTITQQYVKNAFTGKERTIARKVKEAILASQLDRQVDKDEILFRYLSTIYLGEGAYGVGAASETYFRKPVSQLSVSEAALLAGIIPAPSRYEPRGNPELAETKRQLVLDSMLRLGYLTPEQHAASSQEKVWLAIKGAPEGPATVVHPSQQAFSRYPYFVDYVRRYLEDELGSEAVFRGGLEIHTTLHPATQAAAEKAVSDALEGTAPPLEMALAAVEPPTGFVRAIVGGRDFYAADGQVNLALGDCPDPPPQAKGKIEVEASCWNPEAITVEGGGTGRQPGSSWKPFVLAAAFNKGILDSKVYSAPSSYRIPGCKGDSCEIQNYEGAAGGSATLRRATIKSFNTVYAQLIRDVGVKETADMAKRLGISSAWESPSVHGVAYSLGVQEVSPLDMASAFGVFAARGLRNPATPIVYVKDPSGTFLEDNRSREPARVLDEVVADNVTDVLKGVITEGTGTRANIGRPAAGKTGTAQEWRDAWFVGYTPTLSAAVWIGNKEKPTSLRGIKGVSRVAGGTIPAATWKAFMSQALKGVPPTDFNEPVPLKDIAEELRRAARGGIDPGDERKPDDANGGPYEVGPALPKPPPVSQPALPAEGTPVLPFRRGTTTTTTVPTTTTQPGLLPTTSTTVRPQAVTSTTTATSTSTTAGQPPG